MKVSGVATEYPQEYATDVFVRQVTRYEVIRRGDRRNYAETDTQAEAVKIAKALVDGTNGGVLVLNQYGKVESRA